MAINSITCDLGSTRVCGEGEISTCFKESSLGNSVIRINLSDFQESLLNVMGGDLPGVFLESFDGRQKNPARIFHSDEKGEVPDSFIEWFSAKMAQDRENAIELNPEFEHAVRPMPDGFFTMID